MSKGGPMALTNEDIEEEILNNDLLISGGVEDEEILHGMNLEEKKNLLKGIEQSKNEFDSLASRPLNQSALDTSASNFPALPAAGKSGAGRNRLKLPRKITPTPEPKGTDSEESSDRCISLLEDDDDLLTHFNLPFCIDDGAQPLKMPARPMRRIKNPYFVMDHETPAVGLKRMLGQHDRWKAMYIAETRKIESKALLEDLKDPESQGTNTSLKSISGDKENDPFSILPTSPASGPKQVYNGSRRKETNLSADNAAQQNVRQLQRKVSRDSDCEEIETVLITGETKTSEEWKKSHPKPKRNRKQLFNQTKAKSCEGNPDVEFEFDSKWDAGSSSWSNATPAQIQTKRGLSKPPGIEEELKVQCPICQRNFAQSKVENHAAMCEGYTESGSPMEIEEDQD